MTRRRAVLARLLPVVGPALASGLRTAQHGGGNAVSALCGDAAESGCDVVNRSSWSAVFGVPLAAIGFTFYLSLALLLLLGVLQDGEGLAGAAYLAFGLLTVALVVDLGLL